MGSAENFCLRWNDFESNVSGAFRELRAESDFFDVTLTCDDTTTTHRPMQAHKVILSACSNLFKAMLKTQTGHPNPLIYLRGVTTSDLESVLDFMYHGEVNVAQDDLNSFLAVAEDLQIKGLTQNAAAAQAASSSSGGVRRKKGLSSTPSSASAPKRMRKSAASANDEDEDIKEINVKNEPLLEASGGPSTSGAGAQAVTEDDYDDTGDDGGAAGYGDESFADEGDDYAGYVDDGLQGAAGGSGAGAAGTSEQDSTKGRREITNLQVV
jgi:hypothetical protein